MSLLNTPDDECPFCGDADAEASETCEWCAIVACRDCCGTGAFDDVVLCMTCTVQAVRGVAA